MIIQIERKPNQLNMISSKLQAFDFSHPYTQSSKKAQISNEQTFEGIMTGYKTDIETVSWTLDDPLFSFDSGHPQKRRSYSSKILDSSTATATICIYI